MAHHRAVLSDQKLINEINAVRSNFIAHTPKVEMRPVRPPVRPILTRDESRSDKTFFKGGGSKPFQKHHCRAVYQAEKPFIQILYIREKFIKILKEAGRCWVIKYH